ncbi:MAG TPA: hypothetical protein VFZ66_17605 [Herpetosiphonaceae bacterium]
MYQTEADLREERTRRLLYLLFAASMLISAVICGLILFSILAPAQGKRLLGEETEFVVGEVAQVPVKRLELSKLMPNSPQWSQDIIFVIRQRDDSYRAFLALDPKTGCKLNWRNEEFIDDCSQTTYTVSGRNKSDVTTLASQPQHMIELPVETQGGDVYVLDRVMHRDRR